MYVEDGMGVFGDGGWGWAEDSFLRLARWVWGDLGHWAAGEDHQKFENENQGGRCPCLRA